MNRPLEHGGAIEIEILLGAISAQAKANAGRRHDCKMFREGGIGRAVERRIGHGVGRMPERRWRKLQL